MTGINSSNNVFVDGMPHDILDVGRVVGMDEDDTRDVGGGDVDDLGDAGWGEAEVGAQYPQRARRPPVWLQDYDTGDGDE